MYIWQRKDWPQFHWDEPALKSRLDAVRLLQGRLLGRAESASFDAGLEMEMDALTQNAIRTSEIEGEHLDVGSVRSLVARHLGLDRAGIGGKPTAQTEALVALLLEATRDLVDLLEKGCLCRLPGAGRSTRYALSSR